MTTKETHLGERGVHKGHLLELQNSGEVYCLECQKYLSLVSANTAWPPVTYNTEDE